MARSAPNPVLKQRIELGIRILSPLLNLVLAVGDRVSRVLEPDDGDRTLVRMPQSEAAPRGLSSRDARPDERHR